MARKLGIGILLWLCLGLGLSQSFADKKKHEGGEKKRTTENVIALHDSDSPQYNDRCTDCHAEVLAAQSFDPAIPAAHVAMRPFTPGEEDNDTCVWCHRTVNLVQGTQTAGALQGNLRKQVNMTLCTVCHGPFGPAPQFFQTGPPPDQPDGAALYDLVCAACHGDLADSEVHGESAAEIQKNIAEKRRWHGATRDALGHRNSGHR